MIPVKKTPASVPDPKDPAVHEPAGADHAVLNRLLAMAQIYRGEGNLWQAMDLYWELLEDFSGTPQAAEARNVLLELARAYESNGARREARSIYERLLCASD